MIPNMWDSFTSPCFPWNALSLFLCVNKDDLASTVYKHPHREVCPKLMPGWLLSSLTGQHHIGPVCVHVLDLFLALWLHSKTHQTIFYSAGFMCSVCVKWRWKYEWMKKREETFSPRGVDKPCSIFNRSKIALVAVSVPRYGGCTPLPLPEIPRCMFGEISPSLFIGGFPTWSSRLSFLSYCLRGGKLICKRKEVLYMWPQFLILVGDNNLPKEDWVTPPPVPHTLIPRDPGPAAVTPSPNSTLRKSEQVYQSILPAAGVVNPHRSLESNLGKPIQSSKPCTPVIWQWHFYDGGKYIYIWVHPRTIYLRKQFNRQWVNYATYISQYEWYPRKIFNDMPQMAC